jgi:serine protease inhibitor
MLRIVVATLILILLVLSRDVELRESSSKVGQFNQNTQTGRHPIYHFASRLINEVAAERSTEQNILLSPFSIRTALAIIYLGTNGKMTILFETPSKI